jgi:triacylglycerol lipase
MELPLLSYSLFPRKNKRPPSYVEENQPPIVLVHGMAGNSAHFLPLSWYLALNGRRATYRADLAPVSTVRQMGWSLARYIRKVLRLTGKPQVEIVAHSLGGIVARLAIQDHGLEKSVRTLVTLGTPHQGTHSARFSSSRCSIDLRPGSPLIRDLAASSWPTQVRGVCFWSRNDLLILPAESALVPGTHPVDASPLTHFGYLLDPRSWETVRLSLVQELVGGGTLEPLDVRKKIDPLHSKFL